MLRSGADLFVCQLGVLDAVTSTVAALVTRPTVPFRWCTPLVRRRETRDPGKVTRALLEPLA